MVLEALRPVDADPDGDLGFGDEVAPSRIDQRAVCLE
jgi:hypothetical protein